MWSLDPVSKRLTYVHYGIGSSGSYTTGGTCPSPLSEGRLAGLSGESPRIMSCALCLFLCRATFLGFLFLPAVPALTVPFTPPQSVPGPLSPAPFSSRPSAADEKGYEPIPGRLAARV